MVSGEGVDKIGRLAISEGAPLPALNRPTTLPGILQQAAKSKTGIVYLQPDGTEARQSYSALLEQAERLLSGLRSLGLQPQDEVILQLQRPQDFVALVWSCWLGGFIPIPMAVAPSYETDNSKANLLAQAWQLFEQPTIVTDRALAPVINNFSHRLSKACQTVAIESLAGNPDRCWHFAEQDDLALLLLTSGSTGTPKAVMLSARNLLASAYGMTSVNGMSEADITLNWMPLEHVASLIMFHLSEVYLGCQQIQIPFEQVLAEPLRWLDLVDRYRATVTWAPNFAYRLIADRAEAIGDRRWDLSCLRWMGNGAEAVIGKTTQRFLELLAPHGLASTTVTPGYGMSETCSGITHSHCFSASSSDEAVEVGTPIPGVSLRIVDADNRVVEEGTVGLLQVKGVTITAGYYKRPDLDREIFTEDGWFNTGDLGLLREGRLTITGRQKDVIVINGVNYYSHEIEAVVEEVDGVEVSYTAACAVRCSEDGSDRLAIFFNPSCTENEALRKLIATIRKLVAHRVGALPNYLIPVTQATIPKTAIGKIQRSLLSQRFQAGEFNNSLQQIEALLKQRPVSLRDRPSNELERQLVLIWQEVLGVHQVGIHDHFFELGGNSLLLMQVLQRLQEQLLCQLSAVELFQYPTIAALAKHLSQEEPTPSNPAYQGQQRAQRRLSGSNSRPEIAVIGMSGRFPGADNLEQFWQNLGQGVESIAFFTNEELLASGVAPELLNHPNYVKASPILDNIETFDAEFFGYSPKEARLIDPQQRLLLECAWESLEDAGYNPFTYQGAIGLYAGASTNTYLLNYVYPNRQLLDADEPLGVINLSSLGGFQMTVANDKDYLTTRVSYKLNLTGPSVNVQTACSTSLVAIHLACQSLLNGECEMALAGGVSVHAPQKIGYLYQADTIFSPDGHCRAFDAGAQGTIFGSGAGVVVLKRLPDALRDRDRIYAVIKGSAVNNDGAGKVGYLAPNSEGQAKVVAEALAIAGVEAETIAYIEAHGTGTQLGDPIELAGLTQAFRASTQKQGYCAIASVKTNVGHLQIASGVVGFIKTALSLYHRQLPPSLHFKTPNPQIDFDRSPFYVNTALQDWQAQSYPRRAGVNSLGIGGTNVHVVLEEAPALQPEVPPIPDCPCYILPLSAKSDRALQALAQRYSNFLARHPQLSLSEVCFTANSGRAHFDYRLAVIADSVEQMRRNLHAFPKQDNGIIYGQVSQQRPQLAFLFTGQGSQYLNMGRQLYETQPVFRQALTRCDEILHNSQFIIHNYPASLLDRTDSAQPALFALEYALYQLWLSLGVVPSVLMGHSVGEYVAACLAGVFSLEDALKLVAARGRLMQALPPGQMVAVLADEARVRTAIAPYQEVAIAALNGPQNIVISGRQEVLQKVVGDLAAQGIKTKLLKVSHAFHSPLMKPMLAQFEQIAREVTYHPPRLPLVANVTGELATAAIATSDYWCRHILSPVKFAAGMETLAREGCNIFIECGPKPVLLEMGRSCLPSVGVWLPSLRPGYEDWQQLLQSLAHLYVQGIEIDWSSWEPRRSQRRVSLPTYPFQRQRYWLDTLATLRSNLPAKSNHCSHPLLGQRLNSPLKEIVFESQLSSETPPYCQDHCIHQAVVLPGTAYLEMALAAGATVFKTSRLALEDVVIQQALILLDTPCTVQLILRQKLGSAVFEIYSLASDEAAWQLHCSGKIVVEQTSEKLNTTEGGEQITLAQLQRQLVDELAVETHYQQCAEQGIIYGDSFRGIERLWKGDGEALGWIQLPLATAGYGFHPALLDACFQVVLAVPQIDTAQLYLPVGLKRLRLYRYPGQNLWSHVRLQPIKGASSTLVANLDLYDEWGNQVAQIEGLAAKQASRRALLKPQSSWQDWLYQVQWRHQEHALKTTVLNAIAREETGFFPLDPYNPGSWLIFANKGEVAPGLAELLNSKNQACTLVFPGQEFRYLPTGWLIDPCSPTDIERLLHKISKQQPPLRGIVHLWSLDAVENDDCVATIQRGCSSVLHLIQALSKVQTMPPRLWLVTQGAQRVKESDCLPGLAQSCLWGMGKAIAREHPEFRCVQIDLDLIPQIEAQIFAEICWGNDEQVAFRQGTRQVAQLVRYSLAQPIEGTRLAITERGTLENLQWQPTRRRPPGWGEVEIRVHATGLNFRDVLNALDRYPGDPGPLGLECAGEVVAVGAGVAELAVGDAVVALAPGSFSQFVTVPAYRVAPKPEGLTFEEAATIPVAFLTAYYSLHHLAQIQPGRRVLIHAAAGGVGQAAVQLALRQGAEVFATASPNKWDYLKSLGIQSVMNSRTLQFVDEVMAMTQGEGVDLVLNCLAGEFIPRSLSILREKGCFLEIGKQDIWTPEKVAQFRPDVSYYRVELDEVAQQPALMRSLLRQLLEQFQSIAPLQPLPYQVFPQPRVSYAFRTLQQAKHIGKVVVSPSLFRQDATYLITGGLGGLGLTVARWMIESGVRHLVLVGRSRENTVSRQKELEQAGAEVIVLQADIAEAQQVAQVLEAIAHLPPLRGIIHAAGVLDDGVLLQQSWERFERVLAPKVQGAWNLHVLTQDCPLDFFVLFSSAASLVGSAGQANYAAANAFLDALAQARQAKGLPGLSINWGAWNQVGLAAEREEQLQRKGTKTISPEQGLAVLAQLLHEPASQVGVLPFEIEQGEAWVKEPEWTDAKLRQQLETATDPSGLLVEHVCSQVAVVLGRSSLEALAPQQGLMELGLDSLGSVELRNRLQTSLDCTLPSTLTFDYPTVAAIADYLKELLLSTTRQEAIEPGDPAIAQIQELTDAEAEVLLLEELENLND